MAETLIPAPDAALCQSLLHDLRRGDARMAMRTVTADLMSAAARALPDNLELLKKSMPERRQRLQKGLLGVAAALEAFCDSKFFEVHE